MYKTDIDIEIKEITLSIKEIEKIKKDSKKDLQIKLDAGLISSALENRLADYDLQIKLDEYSELNYNIEDLIETLIDKSFDMIIKELINGNLIKSK